MMAKQAEPNFTPMKVTTEEVDYNRAVTRVRFSDISVIILTHNEENHIGRALDSVASIAKDIFIIDSGSTDATLDIARSKGAKVLHNPWTNYATQFQWGLNNAPINTKWIMRLDADEIIEPDLADNIAKNMGALADTVSGIKLKRKHIFMGKWIRHGGRYPLTLLRIWRTGHAHIEDRWMDEHIVLDTGSTVTFDGGFSDVNLGDLTFFTNKHNKYATREALDVLNQKYHFTKGEDAFAKQGMDSNRVKRFLKEAVYNKLPFGVGPVLYFVYRYVFQLGFLDGREGFIYHGLQGLWYRYLVDAKIFELDRQIAKLPDNASRVERLKELTGLNLSQPG